ncbi:MAG: hypothetical protein R3213_07955 [Flavobacteriaceae bacterium]|nr:hypothetical protein [Flavobacteriaceae bacterium]
MKLINLGKSEEGYNAKAVSSYKISGITNNKVVQRYKKPFDANNWFNINGKIVTERKKRILNKWLKEHKKFIE